MMARVVPGIQGPFRWRFPTRSLCHGSDTLARKDHAAWRIRLGGTGKLVASLAYCPGRLDCLLTENSDFCC